MEETLYSESGPDRLSTRRIFGTFSPVLIQDDQRHRDEVVSCESPSANTRRRFPPIRDDCLFFFARFASLSLFHSRSFSRGSLKST